MDPNLPQTPKPLDKKNIIIITIIAIIIVILAVALIYSPALFKNKPVQKAEQFSTNPTPTPTYTPTTLKQYQGTVTSITKDKIIIVSDSATSEFIIDKLTVFGTPTNKARFDEIKLSQKVLITTPEGSNSARLILILK